MWVGDEYKYSIGLLAGIAQSYGNLYSDGIDFQIKTRSYHIRPNAPLNIAEYKADFDMARKILSRRQNEMVEADIEGISEYELEQRGFYHIPQYKTLVYARMQAYLNGKPLNNSKTSRYRFKAKTLDTVTDNRIDG